MRFILRNILFSYLALLFVFLHFTGMSFGQDESKIFFLVSLGLGLIAILIRPLVKLMSLPNSGFLYLLISFIVNLISFFVLDWVLGDFKIAAGYLTNIKFFSFVLSSYNLTIFWSYVLVSVLYTLIHSFLNWLCAGKNK